MVHMVLARAGAGGEHLLVHLLGHGDLVDVGGGPMIAIGATASASVGAAVRWRIFSGSHSASRDSSQQNTK